MSGAEWEPSFIFPYYANLDRPPVIKRAPITVLVPLQPSPPPLLPPPPPPPPAPSPPQVIVLDNDASVVDSRRSSEESIRTGQRRKYTLRNDRERSDPEYKCRRIRNNESVRKTREKKRLDEERDQAKNDQEKNALRGIVKMLFAQEARHLQEISKLRGVEAPDQIIERSGTLTGTQLKLCEDLRKEMLLEENLSGNRL